MYPSPAFHAALGLLIAAVAVLPAPSRAADPAPARPQRPAPLRSPEIGADGRVTFRLRAPKATEIQVSGQWTTQRLALARETNDIWTATTPDPVAPGVWEYSLVVDGLTMVDPVNPAIKPMREPRTSILHIPGQPPLPHDFQDVPHGTVRQHAYFSPVTGRLRELAVYTPPGYDQRRSSKYPTLYLQHGSGDNQATWVVHGKAHWILDNLIAQQKAHPMIVVMMDGHAAAPGDNRPGAPNNSQLFERDLLETVLPFVEANYRVRRGAEHRALAGLSMGGEQALRIGLNHTDTFGWVAGFSAAAPAADTVAQPLAQPTDLNRRLQLLYIACGKDDFLLKRNEDFVELLKSRNIRHDWILTEGNHSWPVWRRYLADLAPRLFQKGSK